MLECGLLGKCLFFNNGVTAGPTTTQHLKMRYCLGGGSFACARFIVAKKLGEEALPHDLFPDQLGRARDIIGFL